MKREREAIIFILKNDLTNTARKFIQDFDSTMNFVELHGIINSINPIKYEIKMHHNRLDDDVKKLKELVK